MPFITEELYHALNGGDAIVASYPTMVTNQSGIAHEEPLILVTEIRNLRSQKGLSPKETLEVWVEKRELFTQYLEMSEKLANIRIVNVAEFDGIGLLVGRSAVKIKLTQEIDLDAEIKSINEEIGYLQGFLKSVDAKLSNERFVANAKQEIVDKEKQKQQDALVKIKALNDRLTQLKG